MRAWIQLELDLYCPQIEADLDTLINENSLILNDDILKKQMTLLN